MHSKDVSTVRISELAPGTHEVDVRDLFARNRLAVTGGISLCPCKTTESAPLVGTVTFSSPSEAKKALNLNGQTLGRSSIHVEREFMGLTILAAPKEPSVDIIAIHGLNGHGYGTWASLSEAKGAVEAMWLRDFLPSHIPTARVIVYGYNSSLLGTHTSVSSIKDFATDLLQRIVDDRVGAEDIRRPIIFICHSLGGLVIKQALVTAHKNSRRYPAVYAASKSLIFFGTPHKGSKAAGIALPISNIAALTFQRPPKQLLQTLKTDSAVLSELLAEFDSIRSSFTIVSIYERRMTPILNALVVDENSSCLGDDDEVRIPIDATHSQMCRFRSASDPLFSPILEQIRRGSRIMMGDVLHKDVPGDKQSHNEITVPPENERRGVFLVPVSVNPYFEGRKTELEKLEVLLNNRKQFGLSSHCPVVAVHGLGGVGKTQLATQYVYNRRAQKPNACTFWVSARGQEELQSGLESVLQKLALDPTHLGMGRALETGLSLLRSWMTLPESGDWLLVLDNYDEIEVKLDDFVPAEAVGSVLITSRDRKIIGSVANSGFSLAAMNELDAKHLFLRLSSPTADSMSDSSRPVDETQALNDTLQELQYFPLAIDQAASFIRENSPMTVKEYLNYLKPRSLDRERLLRFKQARPEYPESVMTTWEISLDYLNKVNPRASWILQLLGFLDNVNTSEDLLLSSTDDRVLAIRPDYDYDFGTCNLPENARIKLANLKNDVGFREAIGTLTSLSLIQRNANSRDLSVHPLVHEWIRVRLNTEPKAQANWTITAALVLFQTFPSEVFIKPSSSWETTNNGHYQFQLIKDHIESLLENLHDYMENLEELPIECYILCETLLLAASFDHGYITIKPLAPPWRPPKILKSTIQSILTRLPPEYIPIASFIHRLVVWIRKQGCRRGSNRTKREMADVLRNLRTTCCLEDVNVLFLMLLAQAVVKVTLCRDDVSSGKSSSFVRQADVTEECQQKKLREEQSNSHLFLALHDLLESAKKDQKVPLLYKVTHFMVKRQLMDCTSPTDFVRCDCLDPSHLLSLDLVAHLSCSETGEHISRLAQLLWDYDGPKDYDSLKLLFSMTYRHWKVLLVKEHLRAVDKAAEHSTMCQTSSGYISCSEGRFTEPEARYAKDLETPLAYLWEITPKVAIEIANPNARWTTRQLLQFQPESSTFALDLAERKSAENVILRMKQLHSKIITLGHSGVEIKTPLKLEVFGTDDLNYALTKIYVLTAQWYKAQRLLVGWLQCSSITKFCNSCNQKGTFPWPGRTNPNPPALPTVKPAPFDMFGPYLSERIQQDDIKCPRVGTWDIPESCNCIFKLKADDMIEALLVVAGAQHRLSAEAELDFERKLERLRTNPHSDESRLGRLEIIYGVAQRYPKELDPQTPTMKAPGAREIVSGLRQYDELEGLATDISTDSSPGGSSEDEDKILDNQPISSEEELDLEW